MRRHSIRFRLTLWYAAVLTAGLGLFGGLIWLSLRHQMMAEVDQDLAGRANRFEKYFRSESSGSSAPQVRDELEEFCQALPSGSSMDLRGASGFKFSFVSSAPAKASEVRSLQRRFTSNGEIFDLQVGASIAGVIHTLDLLRILLWSLLPVVIAIACVGGAWLSGRALKPVQNISDAALTISIENLSERLPVPATGDELARLTEVLNTMFSRLESAVKTLSQFVGDASHELRTPLAVIRTTADLALRRARTPESYRQSLEEVSAEAERMTRLIEDLLVLARSDAAVLEMPLAPLDLRDVLSDVCSEARSLAELRRIRLKAFIGDEPAVVSGNRPALHRLFLALVDNALKYSREGGEVILKVERTDSRVAVLVKDFGAGIPAADLPHIFKRFYRADPARSGDGHGLGLALAGSIAHAHGASIEVESSEGAWSLFRVMFTARDHVPELTSPIS
ncbi:MAG: periplasmic sensor signal transduction histidine kinase [Bryobacterales bacterium]|nr:periplasmic sensor signal transduction histidine kinase [Bryobacterales bacterium]